MAGSNNLNAVRIADDQTSGAHRTANDALNALDAALTDGRTISVTNTNAYTVTAAELRRALSFVIGAGATSPNAAVTISLPASIERGLTLWRNTLVFDVTIRKTGGQTETAPVIAAGDTALIHYDGTNARAVSGTTSSGGGGSSGETTGEELVSVEIGTVAGDGNLTLSGLSAIQGVTPSDGDIILPADQTDGTENRPWIARAGAWDEYTGWETGDTVTAGSVFIISDGDNVGKIFRLITSGTVGTDDLSWNTEAEDASRNYIPMNYSSATTLVLVSELADRRIAARRSGNQTFEIPLDSISGGGNRRRGTGNFIHHQGTGTKTISWPTGVTVNGEAGPSSIALTTQGDAVWVVKYSNNNDWHLMFLPGGSAVRSDTSANLTAGYTSTAYNAGTKSSGTFTPDPANGNLQRAVNGGAHTLAPPSVGDGDSVSMVIQYTNNGSAGTITTSGFTKVGGDSFTTSNGDDFLCYITVINGFSHLNVVTLQ
jgi:hypothetical protein